jgi:hypothetical protein
MKPLLLMAIGRTISAAPLGRREDDVEVRTVPVLPTARAMDGDRPTVVVVDRALLASAGRAVEALRALSTMAALVWIGDETGQQLGGEGRGGTRLAGRADPHECRHR